jgi:hypothetical protein
MAKIRRASRTSAVGVFEDPRPSNNNIYLEHAAHDKTTLAPKFDATLRLGVGESGDFNSPMHGTYILLTNGSSEDDRGGNAATMALTKETAYCWQWSGGNTADLTNVDHTNFFSIDPDRPSLPLGRFVDDGTDDELIIYNQRSTHYSRYYDAHWFNSTKDFHEIQPSGLMAYGGSVSTSAYIIVPGFWAQKDPNSDRVSGIGLYTRHNTVFAPQTSMMRNSFTGFSSDNYKADISSANGYWTMYVGPSAVDGQAIYLITALSTDYQHYVKKHNISADTTTTLHDFTVAPSALGTSAGGARALGASMNAQEKICSRHFDDPGATDKCWYQPYFDTSYNYHPFVWRWDQSTDTFTRDQATNITGDLSSSHMLNLPGSTNAGYGFLSVVWNESFVSGGNRYLTVMPLNAVYQGANGDPLARTIISYSVNASDPTLLTHHSATIVPETIRQCVFLSDDRTVLGVFGENAFYIYNWNNTNGWVIGSTVAAKPFAVGRDSTDRIWMMAGSTNGGYMDTHILTPTIPTRIVITPAASTYNHTGSNISSTFDISAYNYSNERIAVTVSLSIDGSTMTFTDGSATASVTTSTSTETSVGIVITGAGLSDIVANVQI